MTTTIEYLSLIPEAHLGVIGGIPVLLFPDAVPLSLRENALKYSQSRSRLRILDS